MKNALIAALVAAAVAAFPASAGYNVETEITALHQADNVLSLRIAKLRCRVVYPHYNERLRCLSRASAIHFYEETP